jgi:hypothetical protein
MKKQLKICIGLDDVSGTKRTFEYTEDALMALIHTLIDEARKARPTEAPELSRQTFRKSTPIHADYLRLAPIPDSVDASLIVQPGALELPIVIPIEDLRFVMRLLNDGCAAPSTGSKRLRAIANPSDTEFGEYAASPARSGQSSPQ